MCDYTWKGYLDHSDQSSNCVIIRVERVAKAHYINFGNQRQKQVD